MAVATVDNVKTRLELLADAAVTTLLTGTEYAIAKSTLPAVEARPRAATNERHGGTGRLVTREWELWLFVRELTNPEDPADVLPALEACHAHLETVPDYFAARPRLQKADMSDPIVYGTTFLDDSGPVTSPYKGKEYACVRFTFQVMTMRP